MVPTCSFYPFIFAVQHVEHLPRLGANLTPVCLGILSRVGMQVMRGTCTLESTMEEMVRIVVEGHYRRLWVVDQEVRHFIQLRLGLHSASSWVFVLAPCEDDF